MKYFNQMEENKEKFEINSKRCNVSSVDASLGLLPPSSCFERFLVP
jgi:hypothetical protein